MSERASTIRSLCDQWVAHIHQPGATFYAGTPPDHLRLRNNGLFAPDFDHADMLESCAGLTKTLMFPQRGAVLDTDHSLHWAWARDVLTDLSAFPYSPDGSNLRHHFEVIIECTMPQNYARLALNSCNDTTPYIVARIRGGETLLQSGWHMLPFLTMPFLEGLLRRQCSLFINTNGEVLADFGPYLTRKYTKGETCSSVSEVLELYRNEIASKANPEVARLIDDIYTHIVRVDPRIDKYGQHLHGARIIQEWRNGLLHGEVLHSTVGGTVLNLAMLILLSSLGDQKYARAAEHLSNHYWSRSDRLMVTRFLRFDDAGKMEYIGA